MAWQEKAKKEKKERKKTFVYIIFTVAGGSGPFCTVGGPRVPRNAPGYREQCRHIKSCQTICIYDGVTDRNCSGTGLKMWQKHSQTQDLFRSANFNERAK